MGLKPALGDIPTDGVVPLSTLFDHVGPIGRSVDDAALVYHALRGVATPPAIAARDARGLRLGIPRPYFLELMDSQVQRVFDQACQRLTRAGVVLEDVAITHARDAAAIYLHIVLPEAAAYHAATLDSRPDDYSPNVRLRLEMGRYVLAEDYVRALRGRDALIHDVNIALQGRDGLLLPTLPITAPKLGTMTVSIGGVDEPVRNAMLRMTQVFNITGHPAITLPCGRTGDGLPVGAQLLHSTTTSLLDLSACVERVLES